jgi:molecular chaperone DnaK
VTEDWQLGIDFGTITTVAAVRRLDQPEAEMLEIGGSSAVSSAVFVAESGEILAGPGAEPHMVSAPERVVRPKRLLAEADDEGSTLIDGEILRDVDLVAAMLRFVYGEARDKFGGRPPTRVVLTCPAGWSGKRRGRLSEAAATAGIEDPHVIEEPLAAAANLLQHDQLANVPDGVNVAVFDFGGTLDLAIVARTGDAFTLVGPVGGSDALGGESVDHQLLHWIIDELPAAEQAALLEPEGTADPALWLHAGHELRRRMCQAKEALLQRRVQTIALPGPPLSIDELELDEAVLQQHAGATISSAVRLFADFVDGAGTEASDLGAIFLVGGCSRLSLLQRALGEHFPGVPLPRGDDPKQAVALGAAEWRFEGDAVPAGDGQPRSAAVRNGAAGGGGAANPDPAQAASQPGRPGPVRVDSGAPQPLAEAGALKASLLAGGVVLKASIATIRASNESRTAALSKSVADARRRLDLAAGARTAPRASGSPSARPMDQAAQLDRKPPPRREVPAAEQKRPDRAAAPNRASPASSDFSPVRPPPPEPPIWHVSLADLIWPRRTAAKVEIDQWLVAAGEWFAVGQPLLSARVVGASGHDDAVTVHARCSGRLDRILGDAGTTIDPHDWIADVGVRALPYRRAIVPRQVTGLVLALPRPTKSVPDARNGVTVQIDRSLQQLEWAQTYLLPLPPGTHSVTVSYRAAQGHEGVATAAIKTTAHGLVTCAYELNGLRGGRARLGAVG